MVVVATHPISDGHLGEFSSSRGLVLGTRTTASPKAELGVFHLSEDRCQLVDVAAHSLVRTLCRCKFVQVF